MTKLTVFRRQASIDSHVTLRLTRGEDVSGRITEIDDVHVCLDLGGGATITIFEDILAGWEVHQENSLAASAEEPSGHPTTEEHARTISLAEAQRSTDSGVGDDAHHEQAFGAATGEDGGNARELDSAPRTYTPAGHPEVFSLLTRVDATLSEAVKRARLAPLEPDFQFPDAEFPSWTVAEVRREWDRARNQYAYALKVREIGRLNSMVAQILEPLAKRFPGSAATRSLLGRVLMKLNRQSEAKGHLAAAATLSEAPQYWLALASVAGEDTAVECYALRKYFSMASPQHAKDAWFRYLAVATDHCDLGGIARVIRRWSEQPEVELDLRRVLSESAIYLLSSIGSQELALEVAANLEDAARGLPSGWQDEFGRRASPSKELLAAENEFAEPSVPLSPAKQPIRPGEGDRVQHGRIVSFGNQRFGFIDVHWGKTFFFRIDDVTDEVLKYALLYGDWKASREVELEIRPSYGHAYSRAVGVVRLQDSNSLLQRARHLLQLSQHSQAMALVRRVLSANSTDEDARRTETEIKEDIKKQLRDHGTGLPKGKGPYARAKRAQFGDQDLGEAERLLKLAVLQRDKPESAIKDLASLLNQQGRSEEAIGLLESNSDRYKGTSPYDSMLATFYQHASRHDEAITVLTRLRNAQPSKTGPLLKQVAFSYFKLARYDDAEHTLKELLASYPGDRTAERCLAGLEDARSGGSYAEAEELIGELGRVGRRGYRAQFARPCRDRALRLRRCRSGKGPSWHRRRKGGRSHRILLGVDEVLEELRFDGRDVPDFSPPGLDVLASHPTLLFHNAMSTLIRDVKRRSTHLTFVLLIDEFTDIFKEIRKERIPRQFMKAWKAIIERRYFASVLVGQDIMPAFKADFPNEFGVTEDVRVTYLDDVAAIALIQKPIGEKRFAGRAISRLLDLTAGSPYYTIMFCARLVDYMNATRSVIVTEADIHAVEEEMLRGDRRLTIDNLLCAGDGMVDSGIDPDDTRAVCDAIVQGPEREGWCPRELIRDFDEAALDKLLSDIETRDVAERKGTAYRLRVGLFRDWLETQG